MLWWSTEAPKPGWWGTMRRKRSASGSRASKPVTVPAPWRKSSGSPSPALRTAVSIPLTSRRSTVKAAMSAHPRRLAVRGRGRRRAGAHPWDDLVGEQRHVLDRLPLGHVPVLEGQQDPAGLGLLGPVANQRRDGLRRAAGDAAD